MKKNGLSGQGMTEFGLILVGVVIVALLVLAVLTPVLGGIFHKAADDAVNADISNLGYRMTQTFVATIHMTASSTPAPCYSLTLGHTGSGTTPTASPANSTGCSSGQFVAGAAITLSGATPGTGWQILGWSGTANDGSTGTANSLTMPAGSTSVGVTYAQSCYTLSLSHTGSGNNPSASPASSSGCPTSTYIYGEGITLTAAPGVGQAVASWNGTSNDASTGTSNSMTMPAGTWGVSVNYSPACYPLTLSHSGSGNNPSAAPANSTGCSSGNYVYNASISLTASPASGWQVASWSGTTNDASTSTSNTMTMGAGADSASVTYTLSCFTLTLSHTGTGSNPTANPANSTGCPSGQYVANQSISLTAAPGAGWQVASWNGTVNDASTATTNTMTMANGADSASVTYSAICYTLTLTHSGTGNNPTASPTNSTGCSSGQYIAGQSISLSASPGTGWQISSWTGTVNDASTAATNSMTMDAAADSASVTYAHSCYTLTLSHTNSGTGAGAGNDTNPVASPSNSTGCSSGQYFYGTSISLTANTGTGEQVASWTGTSNNSSTSTTNSLSMPANAASAAVNYSSICYTLTLSHTGTGNNPSANPTNSTGCSSGQHVYGESITLTASPGSGKYVSGWSGTTNDSSFSITNTMTMDAAADTAGVTYVSPQLCTIHPKTPNPLSKNTGYFYLITVTAPNAGSVTASWTPGMSSTVYIYSGTQFTGASGTASLPSPNNYLAYKSGSGTPQASYSPTSSTVQTYYVFFYVTSKLSAAITTTITYYGAVCP